MLVINETIWSTEVSVLLPQSMQHWEWSWRLCAGGLPSPRASWTQCAPTTIFELALSRVRWRTETTAKATPSSTKRHATTPTTERAQKLRNAPNFSTKSDRNLLFLRVNLGQWEFNSKAMLKDCGSNRIGKAHYRPSPDNDAPIAGKF